MDTVTFSSIRSIIYNKQYEQSNRENTISTTAEIVFSRLYEFD